MRTRRGLLALGVLVYLITLACNRSMVVVRGPSMVPTLLPGDRILTRPATARSLRTGRLVVLADPHDDQHLVVKRLVALTDATADVRGDAPRHSTDSRSWGPVPLERIRRVVLVRLPRLPGTTRHHEQLGVVESDLPGRPAIVRPGLHPPHLEDLEPDV